MPEPPAHVAPDYDEYAGFQIPDSGLSYYDPESQEITCPHCRQKTTNVNPEDEDGAYYKEEGAVFWCRNCERVSKVEVRNEPDYFDDDSGGDGGGNPVPDAEARARQYDAAFEQVRALHPNVILNEASNHEVVVHFNQAWAPRPSKREMYRIIANVEKVFSARGFDKYELQVVGWDDQNRKYLIPGDDSDPGVDDDYFDDTSTTGNTDIKDAVSEYKSATKESITTKPPSLEYRGLVASQSSPVYRPRRGRGQLR